MKKTTIITIRTATSHDIQNLLTLLAYTFKTYRKYYTKAAYEHAILLSFDDISQRIQDPNKTIIVACIKETIIGTLCASFQEDKQVFLQSMAVLPQFQGEGIGYLLLTHIEDTVKKKGFKKIYFDCFAPLKKSIALYTRCGYKKSGKTRPYHGVTFFEMEKELNKQ